MRQDDRGLWIIVGTLLAGAAIAAYIVFLRPASAPVATNRPAAPAAAPASPRALGGAPDQIDLPPLDDTDGVVRRLVGALSSSPVVNAWLAGSGLIRNLVAVTVNLQEGASPAKLLAPLRPTGAFRVVESGGREYIDPRSYARYDAAADAIVALDPARVARLYATVKPRVEDAYRELGFGGKSFDGSLQSVIVTLMQTPVPGDPVAVRRDGVRYRYADEQLEGLTPAQKQFLRMGPRNVRRVDEWLRQLADALGIPATSLPATSR